MFREHLKKLAVKRENEETTVDIVVEKDVRIGEESDKPITWEEVKSILRKSDNLKAASMDLIPCELYKIALVDRKGKQPFSRALLKIMNVCLEQGFTPGEWGENAVVVLFKKGDPTDTDNYRGITLINTMSKVYCKILAERLGSMNKEYGLIRKEQIGFIAKEQALGAVTAVVEICQRRRALGMETWLGFLDFRKAYDLVPHDLLLAKLKLEGLGLNLLDRSRVCIMERG